MVRRGVVRSFLNTRIPILGTIGLIAFVGLVLLSGCKKDAPVETTPPPKDPRTYTWSVDTIEYPGSFQTLMYDIWGATPADVFAVGYNDIGGAGVMYHFNGTTWNHVPLNTQLGGQIAGAFVLNAIHGLAANDIWAVGERIYINRSPPPNFLDSSLIIHFDGHRWREHPIEKNRQLKRIWGGSHENLWAGGAEGSLYRYSNGSWHQTPLDSTHFILAIGGKTEAYIISTNLALPRVYWFMRWESTGWRILDSYTATGSISDRFGFSLWQSPSGTLYSSGYGVFRWSESGWQREFYNDFPLWVRGTSEDNIFAVGQRGRVFHYNGVDWRPMILIDESVWLTASFTVGNETFIVGNDGRRTYVLHGK